MNEIAKRKSRWQLRAIPSIDFDDVSQILLIHVHKKWHLWDQKLQLEPWLNKVLTHQITNLLRNVYTSCTRPCLACARNEGGDLCSLNSSGKQCNECPIYKEWETKKKAAADIRMPLPIEKREAEVYSLPEESVDIERMAAELYERVKPFLSPVELKVYNSLFIEFNDEETTAKVMGYRTSEKNRKAGYRRIKQIRRNIIEKVKKVTKEFF